MGIGETADRLTEIESAWERGDDGAVLAAFRDWGWRGDPLLESLFLELAIEDEERTWPIYRRWVKSNLSRSQYWRKEEMSEARTNLDLHEERRDAWITEGRYDRFDALLEKQWRIIVEEVENWETG